MVDVAAPPVNPTGGLIKALLPERAVEDVLTGRLRMVLGGEEFVLPVLTIAKADEWRDTLAATAGNVMGLLEQQATVPSVMAWLSSNTDVLLVLIRAYDVTGVLPDDEWIRENATEPDVLKGFMLLLAASYPFVAAALDILAANPGALRLVLEEFGTPTTSQPESSSPTSTPRPITAGRSRASAKRSPTSSSRAT